jgi:dipeptide/tripeptide permease
VAGNTSDVIPFKRKNWLVFALGMAVIGLGYFLLSIPPADGFWSLTMAPILLVVGYCVIIPAAILLKGEAVDGAGETTQAG